MPPKRTTKQSKPTQPFPRRYVAGTHIKERPLAFVDLEFSGLEANNEILHVAAVLVNQPDFEPFGEFSVRVRPKRLQNADRRALRMVGYTDKKWKNAVSLKEALEQFNSFAKGAVLIGYNVVGDFYQLKKSFHQVGLKPAYHWQVLDVQSMIFAELYRSGMDGFRMREVVRYFRLKNRTWHDPLADSWATYDIFKKLMRRIQNGHRNGHS